MEKIEEIHSESQFHPCIVRSSLDALIMINRAVKYPMYLTTRRLSPGESAEQLYSGSVFVYDTSAGSHVRAWTDKRGWSSSRTIGNFYGYVEAWGEEEDRKRKRDLAPPPKLRMAIHGFATPEEEILGPLEPLLTSGRLKQGGLVKRTFAVPGSNLKLVNYVYPSDIRSNALDTPSNMACYEQFRRAEGFHEPLLSVQGYRVPFRIETDDSGLLVQMEPLSWPWTVIDAGVKTSRAIFKFFLWR